MATRRSEVLDGKPPAGPGPGVAKARALLDRPVADVVKEIAPMMSMLVPADIGSKKVRDVVNDPKYGGMIRSQFGSYAQKLGFDQKDLDEAMKPAAKPAEAPKAQPAPQQPPAPANAPAPAAAAPAAPADPYAPSGRRITPDRTMRTSVERL